MLNTLTVVVNHNLGNVMRDEATRISEQQMNDLRGTPALSLSSGSASIQRNFRNLTKTFTVEWVVNPLSANSRMVQIIITWSHGGTTHQISTSSLVSG